MKIEYVKFLNQAEENALISYMSSQYKIKQKAVQSNIKSYKEKLINAYHVFESEKIEDYKNELIKLDSKKNLWESKKCICGANLNYIEEYGFWGCPNYKNNKTTNHITFRCNQSELIENQFNYTKVRLSHNWSSEIIKRCGLKGLITAKELLIFYESEGLEDLRSKYGYKNSMKSISAFPTASKHSKKEELEIQNFLEEYFPKSNYQLYVKYKISGQDEKICIIDLIVSDDDYVFLIEIKRHNIYIDEDQITLYFKLLVHKMIQSNDSRKLKGIFVVNEYFNSEYNCNKCIVFEDLKKLKNKSSIIDTFLTNDFI